MPIGESAQQQALRRLIHLHLNTHYAPPHQPFEILVIGRNLSDGIGDFLHVYDFYKILTKAFKDDPRIFINGIFFIF